MKQLTFSSDVKDFLRVLGKPDVRYLLIGGAAAAAFLVSCAVHAPNDEPTCPDPSEFMDCRGLRDCSRRVALQVRARHPEVERVVTLHELGDWSYTHGLNGVPDDILALDGKRVVIAGYLLPEEPDMSCCLLVESVELLRQRWSPPMNGFVTLSLANPPKPPGLDEIVLVLGVLRVRARFVEGHCADVYEMDVEAIELL